MIGAAAVLAYHNSFSVPFLFDDVSSITGNQSIRELGTAWVPPDGLTVSGRPLVNFTLALNYALSGYDVWSYHVLNLLIHVAAACTLLGIVRRTAMGVAIDGTRFPGPRSSDTAKLRLSRDATWVALAVALLWTVHPLTTQSVTYIIQRAESLAALLLLLTVWCFIRSVEPGASRAWVGLTWFACLAGMAAKETMVAAPVVVLLYDRLFVAGSWREIRAKRWSRHLALAATWLVLIWLVAGTGGRAGTAGFGEGVTAGDYALTQIGAVAHYLRLAGWPHPLVFDYGTELARDGWEVGRAAVLVFPLLLGSLWLVWRGRVAGFLGAGFFVLLAPSSSIVPVVTQSMSEHRMYLPLAALVTLAVVGLHRIWGRGGLAVVGVASIMAGVATSARNDDYQTEETIWEDTVLKRPDNPRALTTLGSIYEKNDQLDLALPLLQRAVEIDPSYLEAQNNLALVWAKRGNYEQAVACYRRAVVLDPSQAMIWSNLGSALVELGRVEEGIDALEKAIVLRPDLASTRLHLASTLARHGRLAEAAAHLNRHLESSPHDAEARGQHGNVLAALGRLPEAVVEFEAAVRLQPGNAVWQNQLGMALAQSGKVREALARFQEAIRLRPDFAPARENAERAERALGAR